MKVTFYKRQIDEEQLPEILFQGDTDKVITLEAGNEVISYLKENIQQDLSFSIDENSYNTKDLIVIRLNILHVGAFFFVYDHLDNQEELMENIKEQIFALQEIERSSAEDIKPQVLELFNTMMNQQPLLGFIDKKVPYVTQDMCSNSHLFLLSEEEMTYVPVVEKKQPKTKTKKNRNVSNFIWDSLFSIAVPLLLAIFIFTICESLYKRNVGLAITFIFISYVEPAILAYDLYSTYKNDQHYRPFSLEKIALYFINIIGVGLGGIISYLLGKNLFKLESVGLIKSFIMISSLVALVIILIVHIIVFFLIKWHAAKANRDNKPMYIPERQPEEKNEENNDKENYHMDL